MISYTIDLSECKHNTYLVYLNIPLTTLTTNSTVELYMPTWIEGSYKIRDFARQVYNLESNAPYRQIANNRFVFDIITQQDSLRISYKVYAFEKTVRTAYLDDEVGFCNPSNILFTMRGGESVATTLKIHNYHFKVHTTLSCQNGVYSASGYQALIDYPLLFAKDSTTLPFDIYTIPHKMVLVGHTDTNTSKLTKHLKKICSYHNDFFGYFPANAYQFLTLCTHDGYGGLEHHNSTALITPRKDMQNDSMSTEYIRFLSLCSHEYFHTWWVKTLKPKAFHTLDNEHQVDTSELWIFEGITSYYDDLSLVKAGVTSAKEYLATLEANINKWHKNTGKKYQSLQDASKNAWTHLYQTDESFIHKHANYYNGGSVAFFVLDALLRSVSGHTLSLDGFILNLYEQYVPIGITSDDFARELEKYISEYDVPIELKEFYSRYIIGVTPLPLDTAYHALGIIATTKEPKASLGATIKDGVVKSIWADSTFYDASVYVGDSIISIDEVAYASFDVNNYKIGDEAMITVHRDDKEHRVKVTIQPMPYPEVMLTYSKDTYAKQQRNKWLAATITKFRD